MSLTEKELARFYANKPQKPNVVTIGGKLAFANMPKNIQQKISNRLAEKDPVIKRAIETSKFNLIIDGQEVGRDNIHEFEIEKFGEESIAGKKFSDEHKSEIDAIKNSVNLKPEVKIEVKEEKMEKKDIKNKITGKDLLALTKKEQTNMLESLGVQKKSIPLTEKGRIDMILKLKNG